MSSQSANDLYSNIFNVELGDPITRRCCTRLIDSIAKHEDIELEGKIGTITREKGKRVTFDQLEPGFVFMRPGTHAFASEVPKDYFNHLSAVVLRGKVFNSRNDDSLPRVFYLRKTLTDSFYVVNGKRVRVSRDEQGKVVESIVKEELDGGHCDILNNFGPFDCRISLKREIEHPTPPDGTPVVYMRRKTRESFITQLWSIDLTQVQTDPAGFTYEIEIELRKEHLPHLRQSAIDYMQNKDSGVEFIRIIKSLIDTLQSLALYMNPVLPVPKLCRVTPEQLESASTSESRRQRSNSGSSGYAGTSSS